jgi:FkbM family methyltransferase
MRAVISESIRRLRPAPLAAALVRISGLDRRRSVSTEKGTFFVNPMSVFGSCLLRGESYEAPTGEVLSRHLTAGGVFIDLGANEGYFSVLASHLVGPSGLVVAVEPQSRLQDPLRRNLTANSCNNVRVIKAAVCSRIMNVNLELTSSMNTGATSLFRHTKYRLPSEQVRGLTLAALLKELEVPHCDLIKIDIEGAECDALMASRDVFRRGVIRNIVVEVHYSILRARGLTWEPVHRFLMECGYLPKQASPQVYSFAG